MAIEVQIVEPAHDGINGPGRPVDAVIEDIRQHYERVAKAGGEVLKLFPVRSHVAALTRGVGAGILLMTTLPGGTVEANMIEPTHDADYGVATRTVEDVAQELLEHYAHAEESGGAVTPYLVADTSEQTPDAINPQDCTVVIARIPTQEH